MRARRTQCDVRCIERERSVFHIGFLIIANYAARGPTSFILAVYPYLLALTAYMRAEGAQALTRRASSPIHALEEHRSVLGKQMFFALSWRFLIGLMVEIVDGSA